MPRPSAVLAKAASKTGTAGSGSARSASSAPALEPRSKLADKFAKSFKAGQSDPPKGAAGLYENVQQSAVTLEKNEADVANWFVAIDSAPTGPVSARTVCGYRDNDRVTDSSLVWREGMADWSHLRDCKELLGLLARIELNHDTAKAPAGSGNTQPKLGLFREDAPKAASPLKGQSVGDIARRMDEFFNAPAAPETEAESAEPQVLEGTDQAQDQLESSFFDASTGSSEPMTRAEESRMSVFDRLSSLPRPKVPRRTLMVVAVGFLCIAVAVFVIQFMLPEKEYVTEYVEKVVYRDRLIEVPSAGKPGGAEATGQEASSDKGTAKKSVRAGTASRGRAKSDADKKVLDEKTRRLMEQLGATGPGSGGPKGRVGTRKTGGQSQESGRLSENQLKGVVTRNRGGLKVCYERALKQGDAPSDRDLRVDFALVVGTSGTVKNIKLKGNVVQYPPLRKCLESSVKRWVFPASSASSPVEFPLVFTPRL